MGSVFINPPKGNNMAQNKLQPTANKIAELYCEKHKVERSLVDAWYVHEEKACYVALNSILVIIHLDEDDQPKVLISANIAASPAVICFESAFVAKEFDGVPTAIHCINPETQEIANGDEAAWEMLYELERQKASSLVQQMVQNVADQKEGQADEAQLEGVDQPTLDV